ncbi:MAG: hypothetical protein KatS3mg076_1345 [Candidatus Binatia bacterium]|nr:MAG: hypothetical protein KatS3mg076_1345 [Candidatus Binatia bacterium]
MRKLPPSIKRKVREGLRNILREPTIGKALKGELAGLRSYKVRRLRIIYREAPGRVVEIVAVGPRRTIYEETTRLLRKSDR